jgi:hypothetical protein
MSAVTYAVVVNRLDEEGGDPDESMSMGPFMGSTYYGERNTPAEALALRDAVIQRRIEHHMDRWFEQNQGMDIDLDPDDPGFAGSESETAWNEHKANIRISADEWVQGVRIDYNDGTADSVAILPRASMGDEPGLPSNIWEGLNPLPAA